MKDIETGLPQRRRRSSDKIYPLDADMVKILESCDSSTTGSTKKPSIVYNVSFPPWRTPDVYDKFPSNIKGQAVWFNAMGSSRKTLKHEDCGSDSNKMRVNEVRVKTFQGDDWLLLLSLPPGQVSKDEFEELLSICREMENKHSLKVCLLACEEVSAIWRTYTPKHRSDGNKRKLSILSSFKKHIHLKHESPKKQIHIPIIADPRCKIASELGIVQDYNDEAYKLDHYIPILRSTFIIRPDGKIVYMNNQISVLKRDFSHIIRVVKELQLVNEAEASAPAQGSMDYYDE